MANISGTDISTLADGHKDIYAAVRSINSDTNLNSLSDVTAGTAAASSAVMLDSDKRVDMFSITESTTVDASAGGVAQTTNLTLVPAGSIIQNVTAVVVDPFDGDATTTLEVGVATNADAYIDTSDFDPSAAADTYASSINGTTNDITSPQYVSAATQLIATWTNTASATAGEVVVYVTFTKL